MSEMKKKRLVSLVAILVSLPLSLLGAATQNFILGGFFGFILGLGIDISVSSFKTKLD